MRTATLALIAALLVAGVTACGGSTGGGDDHSSSGSLRGAGSSLIEPLVQAWIPRLRDESSLDVTYNPIGSGGGIQAITDRTVDFGASDAPLLPDQAKACKGCLLIPWALSATTLSYNLKDVRDLNLSGPVIADIFLGKITKWDDPEIAKLNPGKQLPSRDIAPIFRLDSSGDTYAFTSYLTKVSPDWRDQVGTGTSVNFPKGAGAKGNAGMAGVLTRTEGALGYMTVAYAVKHKLGVASIQNAAGKFVQPDLPGIAAAAQTGKPLPDNSIPIVDPPASAAAAYPISTFTYAIVPKDAKHAAELKKLLTYAIGPGQQFAEQYVFAKLPAYVTTLGKQTIAKIGG
jgi:phosphate transport system substrate-binding protein